MLEWLYPRRAEAWDQMTNVPKPLRQQLSQTYSLGSLELLRRQGARDSTRNSSGAWPTAHWWKASSSPPAPASTAIPATAIPCAFPPRSAAPTAANSAPADWMAGNATSPSRKSSTRPSPSSAPEREKDGPRVVNNLVIMGMGEPLANYDNLLKALRILNAPVGRQPRRPQNHHLHQRIGPANPPAGRRAPQFRLALSLHGATDATRDKIMPVNRKYPLRELVAACEYYQQKKGRMITLEYILIAGVNDALDQTPPLAKLARLLAPRSI